MLFTTKIGRYWRTARHLRPRQLTNRLTRHLPIGRAARPPAVLRPSRARWQRLQECPAIFLGEDLAEGRRVCRVRLLQRERPLDHWEPEQMPRLWRYHLHYFDDIGSPWFGALVERWIAENPPGRGTGWEPYPLSRRIPNWVQWLLAGNEPVGGMVESLARQTESLAAQREEHLQGNHLLANWRALVFAHCVLTSAEAAGAARAWSRELARQLLPDGAHEERSPMYHALILKDLLDLIQLAGCYPGILPGVDLWREQAGTMLGWLQQLSHPDGGIAFFQDAAFDMAPSTARLVEYAARLGISAKPRPLRESGYARLGLEDTALMDTVLLMDVGSPGPPHQPGHAHAGALSVELSHRGRRFLVNSGTSTYEPGPERSLERSTGAHNTVRLQTTQLNTTQPSATQGPGRDQSEMWAAFRVGRRARVHLLRREAAEVSAEHDGYAPVRHTRTVRQRGATIEIEDQLRGAGRHEAELIFHLHPEVAQPEVAADGALVCRHTRGGAIRLHLPGTTTITNTTWRPEFGLHVPNQTLVARLPTPLPATFTTRIELL